MSSQSPTQDQLASFQAQILSLQQFMASIQPTQPSAIQPQDLASLGPNPIAAISALPPTTPSAAVHHRPQYNLLGYSLPPSHCLAMSPLIRVLGFRLLLPKAIPLLWVFEQVLPSLSWA